MGWLGNRVHILSCIAFAATWSATRGIFGLAVFSQRLGTLFWTASMLLWLLAFGFFGIGDVGDSPKKGALTICLASVVGVAGILLLAGSPPLIGENACLLLGCLCICFAFSCHIRFWGDQCSTVDLTGIVLRVAGALVLTSLVGLAAQALTRTVQLTVYIVLFAVSGMSLTAERLGIGRGGDTVQDSLDPYEAYVAFSPRWPRLLLLGIALTLIAIGMVWSLQPYSSARLSWAAGTLTGSLFIYVYLRSTRKSRYLNLMPPIAMTLVQLSVLALLVGFSDLSVPMIPLWIGCTFLWIWSISVCCWQGHLEPEASGRMAARGMLIVVVPNLVGEIIGRFSAVSETVICAVGSALLVFAAEFIMTSKHVALVAGNREPHNDEPDRRMEGLALLAHHKGLTAREYEVLLLLQRGYSMRRIASELSLSENTVKTHSKAVYAKMGVHSRQALIDYVEQNLPLING